MSALHWLVGKQCENKTNNYLKTWPEVFEDGESESEVSFNWLIINWLLIIIIFYKTSPKVIVGGESESEVSFN